MKEPMLLSFNLDTKRGNVFLDNSKVKISGDINDLRALKVTGSPTQAAFDEFQQKFNPLFEKFGKISQQLQMGGRQDR
jgi:hypothetical protein